MPVLLLLLLPIIELIGLFKIGGRIGLVNTLFALIAAAILGAGLARTQGRYILQRLQTSLAKGEMPANEVVHGLLVFIGGVLFLIPGFFSDIVGLILVLPGTRHLVVAMMKRKLQRSILGGQFRVFAQSPFGTGAFGRAGTYGGAQSESHRKQRPFGSADEDPSYGRDVTPKVIDITPISTETRKKPDDKKP